jgi:hypothetical protein
MATPHHHWVAQVHTLPALPAMQTQPSVFPPSTTIVHTPLMPLPLQGVVHVPLFAVPVAHAGGVAAGW